jgi:hypothetical protein
MSNQSRLAANARNILLKSSEAYVYTPAHGEIKDIEAVTAGTITIRSERYANDPTGFPDVVRTLVAGQPLRMQGRISIVAATIDYIVYLA